MGQYHWCEKIFIIVNVYYITSICKQCRWKEKKIIWEKNYNNTVVLQAQNKTPKISHRNLKKL